MSTEGGGSNRQRGEVYEITKSYDKALRKFDIQRAERELTPEVRVEIIEGIARLLAWLVEAGPGANPYITKQRRTQLRAALAQLGIDRDKDHWEILYGEIVWDVMKDFQFPEKPAGYPEPAPFSAKVQELVAKHNSTLGDLRGRDGMELAEYLYGLGFVLASQLSYEYIFPKSDPIVVSANGEIEGRHRYLTLAILGELGFDTSRWHWVHVEHSK